MKTRPTIFISGVSHEFGSFRDAVENEIAMKGCFAENQPGFSPDHGTVEEMLRRRLHDSDAVIHIVGFRFGLEPNHRPANVPRRSYTQMEFDIARELQKPVYVFLSAEPSVRQVPEPDEQPEDGDATALQRAHRDAVQQTNHLYYFFKDQADLCKQVAEIQLVEATYINADIYSLATSFAKYAPKELIGRESETELLADAWLRVRRAESLRPHIITFVALGGEGKTSIVAKWVADLAHGGWPKCDAAFAWSFYSQGTREENAPSSDLFLSKALTFFGDAKMADSAAGPSEKGRRLAQLVGEQRTLLILDGLEPLQYAPTLPMGSELKDKGIAALLKGLAANSRGLCVVTTRHPIPDLNVFIGKTVREEKLARLSTEAGVALLRSLGVRGSLRKTIQSADGRALWNEYEKLVEDVKGHALTLKLLGRYLREAHGGDIRKRDLIKLEEADAEEQGGHAFRVMDVYVRSYEGDDTTAAEARTKGRRALALLQLLGLFDRPATADCLKALWQAPAIAGLTEPLIGISEAQRQTSLTRLEDSDLLTITRAEDSGELIAIDAHALIREYFARRIGQQQPEAWRAAHRRLHEFFSVTKSDKTLATKVEHLQPLYQAVAHGCHAGMYEEAWRTYDLRIQRQGDQYSINQLGLFGDDLAAVAGFLNGWGATKDGVPPFLEPDIFYSAAQCLRAKTRMREAGEAGLAAMNAAVACKKYDVAANSARFMTALSLGAGDVPAAVEYSKRAVDYSKLSQSGTDYELLTTLVTSAVTLHQAGDFELAIQTFRDSTELARSRGASFGPRRSIEVSLWLKFRHYDCLMHGIENAAWKAFLGMAQAHTGKEEDGANISLLREAAADCYSDNAFGQPLEIGPIYISLDMLASVRAALYLGETDKIPRDLQRVQKVMEDAFKGFRVGGREDFFPFIYSTRAWLRCLIGNKAGPESGQSDLDEAWEIAERGSMKLFLADIHLYRARLFFREQTYPWKSPEDDLAEAEKLINDCGYHRRDEELADAKLTILGQASR
jgi:Domain of unknown function (DUF4062)